MFSLTIAKNQAKLLAARLNELGFNIKHAHALEGVAAIYGHKDWNTFAASANKATENSVDALRPKKKLYIAYPRNLYFQDFPVTILQMPPGFGKTHALNEYIETIITKESGNVLTLNFSRHNFVVDRYQHLSENTCQFSTTAGEIEKLIDNSTPILVDKRHLAINIDAFADDVFTRPYGATDFLVELSMMIDRCIPSGFREKLSHIVIHDGHGIKAKSVFDFKKNLFYFWSRKVNPKMPKIIIGTDLNRMEISKEDNDVCIIARSDCRCSNLNDAHNVYFVDVDGQDEPLLDLMKYGSADDIFNIVVSAIRFQESKRNTSNGELPDFVTMSLLRNIIEIAIANRDEKNIPITVNGIIDSLSINGIIELIENNDCHTKQVSALRSFIEKINKEAAKVESAIEASVYLEHGKLILPVIDGLMFLSGKHGYESTNNVFIKCTVMQAMEKVSEEILIHRMKNRANA